jgi:thiamine kinase-like enzyme
MTTITAVEHECLALQLLSLLQMAIPTITACTILDVIVQANAQGFRVTVEPPHRSELFVKRVVASEYQGKKQWTDLHRTLLYGRTEVRFYKEILPRLPGLLKYAPHCHIAEYNLEGLLIAEAAAPSSSTSSETTGPSSPECVVTAAGLDGGAFLVLDSVGTDRYFQESPLSFHQAVKCLEAVAQLHAAAYENVPLLQRAHERMARGSYHLTTRNRNEWKDMVRSWQHFVNEFGEDHAVFSSPSVQNLGQRMHEMAEYVSKQLTPLPGDKYATLCHGDFKAMNVFLPHDMTANAVLIDFASTGVGLGMSDVAMHVIHSVLPCEEEQEEEEEEALVNAYLTALRRANPTTACYPREVAMRHYRLACVDYVRFIMGRFWRDATKESFEKKKLSKNTTLINRNVDAAMAWIARVDKYLSEFEKEKRATIFTNLCSSHVNTIDLMLA